MLGDTVVVHADGATGSVTWYSIDGDGASIADRARLGRNGRPVTPEDITEEMHRLQRLAVAASPAAYDEPKRISTPVIAGTPSVWSVATRAIVSDDGALWVGVNRISSDFDRETKHFGRIGDDNTWTVFPASRREPAYAITLPPFFRLTSVQGGRIYGFIDNGIAAPEVEVYVVGAVAKSP